MGKLYRDLVRKHSTAKGSARALLNVLADYADDDGLAWPTRATLASDTGMSERNVTRCLQKLCDDGRLVAEENASGGRGRVPVYKIIFPELAEQQPVSNSQESQKGDNLSPKRETDCHPLDAKRVTNAHVKGDKLSIKGDKCAPIPSYARSEPQEPQIEPERERAQAPALTNDVKFESPIPAKPLTPQQEMYGAICEALGWDYHVITDRNKVQVAQTVKILTGNGYTVDDIRRFMVEIWFKDWRWEKRQSYPTLTQLREEIGKIRSLVPAAAPPPKAKGLESLRRLEASLGVNL